MTVKLLIKQHLELLNLKEAAKARLSLFMSKCQIVGNHVSWLICRMYPQIALYAMVMQPI